MIGSLLTALHGSPSEQRFADSKSAPLGSHVHRGRPAALFWFIAVMAIAMGVGVVRAQEAKEGPAEKIRQSITELRLEDAAENVVSTLAKHSDNPTLLRAHAELLFYQGRYAEALSAMRRALAKVPEEDLAEAREFLELVESTHDTTKDFLKAASDDGRYIVFYPAGPEAVMVPHLIRVLEKADKNLEAILGYRHPGPIRIEVFPTTTELASVSTLSVEEIERTGTIALCKWDRLMLTSPGALVRGYHWTDTAAHEFVHLVVSRMTFDHAPVWLQEGLARSLEHRWNQPDQPFEMSPDSKHLLLSSAQKGKLLPFDRLHPSIARLPSQRDAALAFAQVSDFISRFHEEHGHEGLRQLLHRVGSGEDARQALASIAGMSWSQAETRWRKQLQELSPKAAPQSSPNPLIFKNRGHNELDEVKVSAAKKHIRLGDLLWHRSRPKASAREYERALKHAPDDPLIVSRFARASIESDDAKRALAPLQQVAKTQQDYAPLQSMLGVALHRSGKIQQAADAYIRSIHINPFDPEPHCGLAEIATDNKQRTQARQACQRLRIR